ALPIFDPVPSRNEYQIGQSLFFCKMQSVLISVYGNNSGRRIEAGTEHGTQTCGTGANHGNRIRGLYFPDFCRPVSGGENISVKKRLFICHAFWNFGQSIVCKRNSGILGLTAVNPAAQRPSAVFFCTVINTSPAAVETLSAECLYIYSYPVTGSDLFYRTSCLNNSSGKFMPQNRTRH